MILNSKGNIVVGDGQVIHRIDHVSLDHDPDSASHPAKKKRDSPKMYRIAYFSAVKLDPKMHRFIIMLKSPKVTLNDLQR